MSFWQGGKFQHECEKDGGDYDSVRDASLAFCIIGTVLFCLEMPGLYMQGIAPRAAATCMCLSAFCEDVPQLVLQQIHFGAMDWDVHDDDGVALFALVGSILSIVFNVVFATMCSGNNT